MAVVRRGAKRQAADALRPDSRWNRLAPYPLVAALAGVGTAVAGWSVCAAGTLLGWLSSPEVPVGEPLALATRLWLAGQFARVEIGGASLSIAPLGLTFVLWVVGGGLAALAVQHSFDAPPPPALRRHWMLRIGAVFGAANLVVVGAAAGLVLDKGHSPRALVGAFLVSLAMAFWGTGRALGWRLDLELVRLRWPRWLDALPRALAAGGGLALAGGAVVMFVALLQQRERVVALATGLEAGLLGGILLLVLQAAWLPNAALWAVSWTVGSGFSVGQGSIVAPLAAQVGLLPSIPLFGALPASGVGSPAMALWLLVPMAAGVAAAWVMVRALLDDAAVRGGGGTVRPDVAGLVGAFSGGLTGVVVAAIVALAGGDLGQLRLVRLGAHLPGLFGLAPALMGLAGLVAGLLIGWRHYRPVGRVAPPTPLDG